MHLRPRLDGLTDEEYFWEPVPGCWTVRPDAAGNYRVDQGQATDPPPVTTIAWRMMHIAVGCFVTRSSTFFGDGSVGDDADMFDPRHVPADLPHTAEEAVAFLDDSYREWHGHVSRLGEAGLSAPLGPKGAYFSAEPMAAPDRAPQPRGDAPRRGDRVAAGPVPRHRRDPAHRPPRRGCPVTSVLPPPERRVPEAPDRTSQGPPSGCHAGAMSAKTLANPPTGGQAVGVDLVGAYGGPAARRPGWSAHVTSISGISGISGAFGTQQRCCAPRRQGTARTRPPRSPGPSACPATS